MAPESDNAVPAELITDFLALSQLSETQVNAIREELSEEIGILTHERLNEVVSRNAPSESVASILRLLFNASSDFLAEYFPSFEAWRTSESDHTKKFPDELLEQLKLNLELLIQDYPALQLLRKANQLLRDTGNELQWAQFTCDRRPVFNDLNTSVEGFVTIINLQFIYNTQSDDRKTFEAVLTESDLKFLVESGTKALEQAKLLK